MGRRREEFEGEGSGRGREGKERGGRARLGHLSRGHRLPSHATGPTDLQYCRVIAVW